MEKWQSRRMIYRREEDRDLWDRVDEYCQENRVALSAVIVFALRQYFDESEHPRRKR